MTKHINQRRIRAEKAKWARNDKQHTNAVSFITYIEQERVTKNNVK